MFEKALRIHVVKSYTFGLGVNMYGDTKHDV